MERDRFEEAIAALCRTRAHARNLADHWTGAAEEADDTFEAEACATQAREHFEEISALDLALEALREKQQREKSDG